jgi:hypothetical protein
MSHALIVGAYSSLEVNVMLLTKAYHLSALHSSMTFAEFETTVQQHLEIIPAEYLEGLQGVHCFPDVKRDPLEPGLVRLGEYLDPGPDQFLDHRVHIGRHVSLYYGSFQQIAHHGFDWEAEIWETLTHELQHHVESKAGDRTLIEWDIDQMRRFKARKNAAPNWSEFA